MPAKKPEEATTETTTANTAAVDVEKTVFAPSPGRVVIVTWDGNDYAAQVISCNEETGDVVAAFIGSTAALELEFCADRVHGTWRWPELSSKKLTVGDDGRVKR